MATRSTRRVLLKISGEALMGEREYGLDPATVDRIAERGQDACTPWASQVCLVIGGGNIFRGVAGAAPGHGPRQRPTTWACWRR